MSTFCRPCADRRCGRVPCAAHAPHQDRRHHRSGLPRSRGARLAMVEAGMDVARLNFSHGSPEEHAENVALRARGRRARRPPGRDPAGPARPEAAHRPAATTTSSTCRSATTVTFACGGGRRRATRARMTINWAGLSSGLEAGEVIYLADGVACACAPPPCARARTRSTRSSRSAAAVASRQGLNMPGPVDELPPVPEEDLDHLRVGERDRRRPGRAVVRAPVADVDVRARSTRACR